MDQLTVAQRFKTVQEAHRRWAYANFGINSIKKGFGNVYKNLPIGALAPNMGISEEIGELAGALLDRDDDEVEDALGDIAIYFVNLSNDLKIGLSPDDSVVILDDNLTGVLCRLLKASGKINHTILKRCQGIRGMDDDALFQNNLDHWGSEFWRALDQACYFWCQKRAIDILEKVWEKVSQRDWTKNSTTGA